MSESLKNMVVERNGGSFRQGDVVGVDPEFVEALDSVKGKISKLVLELDDGGEAEIGSDDTRIVRSGSGNGISRVNAEAMTDLKLCEGVDAEMIEKMEAGQFEAAIDIALKAGQDGNELRPYDREAYEFFKHLKAETGSDADKINLVRKADDIGRRLRDELKFFAIRGVNPERQERIIQALSNWFQDQLKIGQWVESGRFVRRNGERMPYGILFDWEMTGEKVGTEETESQLRKIFIDKIVSVAKRAELSGLVRDLCLTLPDGREIQIDGHDEPFKLVFGTSAFRMDEPTAITLRQGFYMDERQNDKRVWEIFIRKLDEAGLGLDDLKEFCQEKEKYQLMLDNPRGIQEYQGMDYEGAAVYKSPPLSLRAVRGFVEFDEKEMLRRVG